MDTNQPTSSMPGMPPPPPGIFGTRIPSTVVFAVGVLLFLLPFAEIKCNNTPLMENTGLGIAMGKEWKMSTKNMLGGLGSATNTSQYGNTKKDPNVYAIIALALGVTGLILSIPNARGAFSTAMFSGALAAISLIGLWIDLRKEISTSLGDIQKGGDTGMGEMKLSLQLTPWFYISVIAFLVAAFFCYKRLQATKL